MRKPLVKARKLIVPIVLTVSAIATAFTVATTVTAAGCGEDNSPPVDAAVPDTPLL